jgi:hypothetical protein
MRLNKERRGKRGRRKNVEKKYKLSAFNYPFYEYQEHKSTRFLVKAIAEFVYLSFKYDGVELTKRGKYKN